MVAALSEGHLFLRLPRRVDVQCPVEGVVQVDQVGHRFDRQFAGVGDGFAVLGQVRPVVALLDVVVRTERARLMIWWLVLALLTGFR